MVSLKSVEQQLKQIGCNFTFWGRPEIVELAKILIPGEMIAQCVNGRYEGGFALLVATDHRILLVDKKPLYLTLDDIRFDMISDINYSHRLLDATLQIMTTGQKTLHFTAYSQTRLRKILDYTQKRVTEIRHRQGTAQQAETKLVDEIERLEAHAASDGLGLQQVAEAAPTQPPAASQPQQAMHDIATENIGRQPSTPQSGATTDSFNGFRRHVSLQIAHYIGPRAVAFSQLPPTLNMYKLPFARRHYNKGQPTTY